MNLNLEPYQAALPYPDVKNVRPDKQILELLMEGYCGESSETTTVMQYAYHSLLCRKKHEEIARAIRGVYYVETLHQQFLGDLICRLGGDPKYLFPLREKKLDWQASVVNYEAGPSKMLMADIEGEKGAAAYYDRAAKSVNQPEIAALLARLAEDERLHARMFSELYRKYFR